MGYISPGPHGAPPMAKKSAKQKKLKKSCCDKPARKMCKRCPRRAFGACAA